VSRSVFALLLPLSLVACGQSGEIEVKDAWARDTVGSTAAAAVFMTIASPTSDRLVGASTPVAGKTDLMTMEGGNSAMRMTYLEAIDIPADTPVSLEPGGLHVWLADLGEPLSAGQSFPLVLRFEKAGERRIVVPVIGPATPPPSSGM